MSRRPGWEEAFYRGIPAGSPVDGVARGAAWWRNVSTVRMATRKSHGKPPNAPNAGWFGLGFLRLLPQHGDFLVVSAQPIGLSQLELQPPNCGREHIVPDGFSRIIRPSAAVAHRVEAISHWDFPYGDRATRLTIKMSSSTMPAFPV